MQTNVKDTAMHGNWSPSTWAAVSQSPAYPCNYCKIWRDRKGQIHIH